MNGMITAPDISSGAVFFVETLFCLPFCISLRDKNVNYSQNSSPLLTNYR